MTKKPLIGIITILDAQAVPRVSVNINYQNAVIRAGGVPILLPVTREEELLAGYADMCDGFLFSGGQDISPCRYNELPSRLTGPSSLLLDDYQLNLMKLVLDSKKPFIAICRGIQVLNVACGGTLYQDLTEFSPTVSKHMQETDRGDVSHPVTIQEGTRLHSLFGDRIWTNSYHHQALKRVPGSLKVAAHSDDGVVEAVEVRDLASDCSGIRKLCWPLTTRCCLCFRPSSRQLKEDRTPESNKYAKREDARPLFSVFSILL